MEINITAFQIPGLTITLMEILYLIVTVVIALSIRFFLNWLLSGIASRGVISLGTKSFVSRVIDIATLVVIVLGFVSIITASLTPYMVVLIIGVLTFVIFYHEIREFSAFINIQLLKLKKNLWVEIYLPGIDRPLIGRILDITPFNAVLEDILGNKVHIANSVLVNSVFRERQPHVVLRVKITSSSNPNERLDLKKITDEVKKAAADVLFRVESDGVMIKSIREDSVELILNIVPVKPPVKVGDIYKLVEAVYKALNGYNPEVEVTRTV
ncbi:MAG: hypothetical protein B7O98_06440 [Zestosphaera tikiterensis]|uniref:Mechanosensitive ion channel protein MscS n=1 Tax=Zestosphaera tikiterensis TaxID=1973259 RepID=A0A2R7Y414_9CREN|nr:MAG: hypothetical protein B7O98_06440 [Zestosphaera tikiterensis]